MSRYLITTHSYLPGARLSCMGHFGNLPFPSVEAAAIEARRLGAVVIERNDVQKRCLMFDASLLLPHE